ncbi:MAG: energy transducer TonB [Bacteroidales bacterium]|nr:energy transducer TonB [Bacteroidales bacterium]
MKKAILTIAVVCGIGLMSACMNAAPKVDPNDTAIFTISDDDPEFPGGEDSLYAFFRKNIRYPEAAKEQQVEGRVYVRFVVEKDGSITNAEVLRDVVYGSEEADSLAAELGCGAEVLRVIDMMPAWKPAVFHGYVVRRQYVVPVQFSLTDSQP